MKIRRTLGLLCLCGVVGACGETREESEPVVRSVLTTVVESPSARTLRSFSGVAQSRSEKKLSFRVSGEVVELRVEVGDLIDSGVVVARLDAPDYEIDVREARASVLEVRARLRNDDAAYARTRALYAEQGATKEDLDEARATAEATRASLAAAAERRQLAERQLAYTTLRAPIEGAVSEVPIEVGENVSAGQTVVVMQTGGRPEVEVAIPEVVIGRIEEGDEVEVEFDAVTGERYVGRVVEVAVAPSSSGSAFPVTVSLEADWDPIRPGLAARVSFRLKTEEAAAIGSVVVPASAIGHDQRGHYVFLAESAEGELARTERREVAIGAVSGEGITVLEGLEGGETIVAAGVPRVRDGLAVRVLDRSEWF